MTSLDLRAFVNDGRRREIDRERKALERGQTAAPKPKAERDLEQQRLYQEVAKDLAAGMSQAEAARIWKLNRRTVSSIKKRFSV